MLTKSAQAGKVSGAQRMRAIDTGRQSSNVASPVSPSPTDQAAAAARQRQNPVMQQTQPARPGGSSPGIAQSMMYRGNPAPGESKVVSGPASAASTQNASQPAAQPKPRIEAGADLRELERYESSPGVYETWYGPYIFDGKQIDIKYVFDTSQHTSWQNSNQYRIHQGQTNG